MDISATIAIMKQDPAFAENVGMVLIHNGIVRGWSRDDHRSVEQLEVTVDAVKVESIRYTTERLPGIYKVKVETRQGVMQPGDDLLFLIVAGDIREHVKPALATLLERLKTEAIHKKEVIR